MNDAALLASWALALVFAVSSASKFADRTGTADAVVAFGAPEGLRWAAPLIPAVELLLVVLLVTPGTARWGAMGAVALLAVFSTAVAVNLVRGRRPDCNCFGRLSKGPVGAGTLARNGVLLLFALVASRPDATSPSELVSGISVPVALAVVGGVVVAAGLAALVWLVLELWRQQARLLDRIDVLEAGGRIGPPTPGSVDAPQTHGPPLGTTAPDVRGTDAAGVATALSHQWSADRRTLLVFGDPTCRSCTELSPDLSAWLDADRDRRHLVIVSRSADIVVPDGATVFVEQDRTASIAYGVRGTPSAVLVDESGVVASVLAEGPDQVRVLLSSAAASGAPRSAPVRFRPRPVRNGEALPDAVLPSTAVLDPDAEGHTLLLFWNEHCSHCRTMADDLVARSRAASASRSTDPLRLVVVVPSADQLSAVTDRLTDATAVVDRDMRTNLALGVPGTPSAALIGPDRRLAADLAVGPDAILSLMDRSPTHRRRRHNDLR